MEDLTEYCHPDSTFIEEQIPISEQVSLRVISFTSGIQSNNPCVMFIPGMISQIRNWGKVLREMTRDFPVYYIETREKISSMVKGNQNYGIDGIRQDIVTLTAHFNLKSRSYILFGSSLGGTVILDACRFLTRDPICLVLVGPNALFRMPPFSRMAVSCFPPGLYSSVKPLIKWYLKTYRLDPISDYAQYKKYCSVLDSPDPWKLKKAMLAVSRYEVWDYLEAIKYPVLIFGGSKDVMHEPGNLKKMVTLLKDGTYVDMETNANTHSKEMVFEMRKYVKRLTSNV